MIRKLASVNNDRIILFDKTGNFIVDSHQMLSAGGVVEVEDFATSMAKPAIRAKAIILAKEAP